MAQIHYYVDCGNVEHVAIPEQGAVAILDVIDRTRRNKIVAVKTIRGVCIGCGYDLGLKEAKDVIETVAAHYGRTFDPMPAPVT